MTRDPGDFQNRDLAFDGAGQPNPWYYEMAEPGFNYRVSDIHCALGLSQIGKLSRFVERRRGLARRYDELLKPLAPILRPLGRVAGCRPAWHLYVALIDFEKAGTSRARLMQSLHAKGIGSQVHYIPVHTQPYYRKLYSDRALPGADAYYRRCLTLPLHAGMTDADVGRAAAALSEALRDG
jgi:dTDP-4-amino-4,6-dideoxygalactose transaminase